ncbi:hypothetical protein SAMN03159496_05506 [Rhizobium sp. NFR07]|nr:hypothetical protein SAMN03159496_05506 [Rhizobium sp. NFR07]
MARFSGNERSVEKFRAAVRNHSNRAGHRVPLQIRHDVKSDHRYGPPDHACVHKLLRFKRLKARKARSTAVAIRSVETFASHRGATPEPGETDTRAKNLHQRCTVMRTATIADGAFHLYDRNSHVLECKSAIVIQSRHPFRQSMSPAGDNQKCQGKRRPLQNAVIHSKSHCAQYFFTAATHLASASYRFDSSYKSSESLICRNTPLKKEAP